MPAGEFILRHLPWLALAALEVEGSPEFVKAIKLVKAKSQKPSAQLHSISTLVTISGCLMLSKEVLVDSVHERAGMGDAA